MVNSGKQADIYYILKTNYNMEATQTQTFNSITKIPNLLATDRLVLVHLYSLYIEGHIGSHVLTSSKELGYTRQGYLKVIQRLMKYGYVNIIKRGWYSLNINKL